MPPSSTSPVGPPLESKTGDALVRSSPQVQALVSFLEHESQPMIVLDPDYNILAANTAYQRQFGAAGHSYVGQKCFRVSHHYDAPCDLSGEHCPMKKAFESRGPDRVLHIHHTPRGPEHVDVELRPILDDRREVIAYVERLSTVRSASAQPSAEGLVGSAPAFNAALESLQRVAPSMLPVLLLGESGTGKELFARALHEASQRARGPFVVVDCSGFTEALFESELFGYEKGAFTGAVARKPGLVETAKGGTLFLDEVGDIPLPMQVKLLRLIESGTFRRVGGVETQRADFRLVSATHRSLAEMVADGRFRQDLYYRISAFPIHLPALRERLEDIPLLVDSFLKRGNRPGGAPHVAVSAEAMAHLRAQSWPGNIRELRNVLDRARLFADDGVIQAEHVMPHARGEATTGIPSVRAASGGRRERLSDAELRATVLRFGGTRKELAAALGLSERSLYRKLKNIDP
ncbi:MAG: sigma 54-interacting transcriptional regulator [Gammaproteobacteria bacterium]|nr:sigma 54-interacting transcriptional regulator [Gammaproteobacteria bacterium]MBU1440797.1 sigma 54-interacting transcriptional regulator [Gammaproteobacteria bacterium]MBU2286402.1 sigma 54-interacting transcriptional regulator [Gammaproteobacteria bacterium]